MMQIFKNYVISLERKILKIKVDAKDFKYISDNSKEADKDTAFLITKSSEKYIEDAEKNGAEISLYPEDLYDFFDLDIKIIGITGTNGKTTTTAIIYSLLLDLGYRVALLGTRGFFINDERIKEKGLTTPSLFDLYLDIKKAKELGCDFFVMEVSSHAIEQNRIEGLEFALKVHTNITQDHLDYHKTLQSYIDVKNSFFQDETLKLVNKDDKNIDFNPKNAYSYSIDSSSSFAIEAYSLANKISAVVTFANEKEEFHSELYALFNLYNLLAGIASVKLLTKKPLKEICEEVDNFAGVAGRLEVVNENPLVIVDFAHTPDGLKKVLEEFKTANVTAVFGAGGDRDRGKRAIMGRVVARYAKKTIITSDNPRSEEPQAIIDDILENIENRDNIFTFVDREEAILFALENQVEEEIVIIFGKGDETYQIFKNETIHFDDREVVREFFEV